MQSSQDNLLQPTEGSRKLSEGDWNLRKYGSGGVTGDRGRQLEKRVSASFKHMAELH